MPTVADWQHAHTDRLTVVIASSGSADETLAEAEEHGLEHVLVDEGSRLYRQFEANGTPSAVLLSPDGTIASWVASGSEWIEQLVAQSLGDEEREAGLPLGAEAPPLELPSLDGEMVSLADLRGRDAVLLFWNPNCGYCRAMHDDVLAWEASANGVHPRLVIVSSGDEASTRAEEFRSRVLLDESFAAGTAFGAGGTPMAVRLDAEGRIASAVVAGGDAVLALANTPAPV
jgi:thiol-disulfide isomerase/thioredoxin